MNPKNSYSKFAECLVFQALLVAIVYFLLPTQVMAARVVAEKRECAICHIAWISDFKREDIKTLIPYEPRPMMDTGRQDVVSNENMCFSCHDGFVLDSRFLWLNKQHTHPVGMVPSDRVKIPKKEGKTIFPLNDDGKVYCGTCHSAHGVEWGDKTSPVFLRTPNIGSSLCKTCHVDRQGEQGGHLNHPIDREVPDSAKKLLESGSRFSEKNEVICQSCHRVHGSKEDKLLVVKNDRSQLCANCHQEKTRKKGGHLTHPVNIVPKDVKIPEKFSKSGSHFGPSREVICQTCHEVHLAPTEKLLVLNASNLEEGICVNCHDKKRTILANGHNLLRNKAEKLKGERKQPSSNLGVCGVCHNMHDGKGAKMWARDLPQAEDGVAALCLSCHSEGAPAEKHTVGKYSHPVGAALPKNMKINDLPLFTKSGAKTHSSKYGLVTCPTCHDVHGPASKLKKEEPAKDEHNGIGKYLRKGEGDLLALCKTCHKDKWSIKTTKHDINSEKQDDMPLGVCNNCHQVHNGKGPRMWAREDSVEDSDPGSLCKSCHRRDGLAKDKTTGDHSHPVDISVEKAGIEVTRNGWVSVVKGKKSKSKHTLPLYDNNGKKVKRGSGKVFCATCHDPHRWTTKKETRASNEDESEEGDANNSFLRVPAAPDGELCVTCHRAKATVRATDHDLSVTAPEASNKQGEGFAQSGICGQCHTVHNAEQDLALWGRIPGPAVNAPEALCRSCHQSGEIAQKKVPEKASHPAYVMAWDGAVRDPDKRNIVHLPVFSDNGSHAMTGYITCPTCHNVHQWRSGEAKEGPGKNEEGDVFSSFLRMGSTENVLCADCHGIDAIFRYKYFHGVDFKKRKDE